MQHIIRSGAWLLLLLLLGLPACLAQSTTTTSRLSAEADASIYGDNTGFANGQGGELEVGKTRAGTLRRALLRFSLADIPANATISSATLSVVVDQNNFGAHVIAAHRVATAWTEGPSSGQGPALPGDVTWLTPSSGTGRSWSQPGGDIFALATTAAIANAERSRVGFDVTSDALVFAANPALNNGWLLKVADEGPSQTLKRFASAEFHDAAQRPVLEVVWFIPEPTSTSTATTTTSFETTTTVVTTTTQDTTVRRQTEGNGGGYACV